MQETLRLYTSSLYISHAQVTVLSSAGNLQVDDAILKVTSRNKACFLCVVFLVQLQ